MYLSDLNRLEKYLAKFKSYVNAGYQPTEEEQRAMQVIEAQVAQIEETLFHLRAAKGSVSGLMLKSLTEAKPQEFNNVTISANEKGFSISLPIYNLIAFPRDNQANNNYYGWNEQLRNFAIELVRASQRHYSNQEVTESQIGIVLKLNNINPKLHMYNIRFISGLEFNFDISKKLAQNENERNMIAREVMRELLIFIQSKINDFGAQPLVVPQG